METIYKTEDGKLFSDRNTAQNHADDQAKFNVELAKLSEESSAAIRKAFNDQKERLKEGKRLCEEGKLDEAIAVLNQIPANSVRLSSGKPLQYGDYYTWHGRCYLAKKDYKNALNDFNGAVYSISHDTLEEGYLAPNINIIPAIYFWRGSVLELLGDKEKAIDDFKSAVDWGWLNDAVFKEKGFKDVDIWELTEALKKLKSMGVSYTPKIPTVMPYGSEKPKESSSFRKINTDDVTVASISTTTQDSKKSEEYFMASIKASDNGNFDEALNNINRAIEIGGIDNSETYGHRGMVYMFMKEYEKAISDFKIAADYGDENSIDMLKKMNVAYTPKNPSSRQQVISTSQAPQQQSSSSSSSSESSTSKGKDTLVKIGLVLVGIFIIYKVLSFLGIIPF